MKLFSLICLGVALLNAGCMTGGFVETTHRIYPSTDPATVQILFSEPQRPNEQIGIVTATGGSIATETQLYRKLQAKAAEMGADAVVIGAKDTSYWSGQKYQRQCNQVHCQINSASHCDH